MLLRYKCSMNDLIVETKNKINKLIEELIDEFDFKKIEKTKIKKDKKIDERDVSKFQSVLKNYKKNKEVKSHETPINDFDLINSNIFNFIKDENKYLDWKQLDNNIKLEKLNFYLDNYKNDNNFEIDKEIYDDLKKLILDNKINFKKYIEYDKINSKIISLPILVYENNNLVIKIDNTIKKKIKKNIFQK